jgi:hypothetical protein
MNFLPDASLLSKWGSARQPFFALVSFEGQIAATTLPKTIADSGNSANSGILLADYALHFRGFGALPKFRTPFFRRSTARTAGSHRKSGLCGTSCGNP